MIEAKDEVKQVYQDGERFPRSFIMKRDIIGTTWIAKPFNHGAWLGPFYEWSEVVDLIHECSGMIDVIEGTYLWIEDHWQKASERMLDSNRWIDPIEMLERPDTSRQVVPELKQQHEMLMQMTDLKGP